MTSKFSFFKALKLKEIPSPSADWKGVGKDMDVGVPQTVL